MAPGVFKVSSVSTAITITRQDPDQTSDLGWVITSSPDAALMWQLNLSAGATLNMANVLVKYSDARAHPVAVPSNNVTLFTATTLLSPLDQPPTYT